MRYTKHYSSPTELLTILQDRGLDCSDIDDAESILRSVGYYRLSGYLYPFLKVPKSEHRYKSGSTLGSAVSLYEFDREFRQLVFDQIERIEVAVRSTITNIVCAETGDVFWMTNLRVLPIVTNITRLWRLLIRRYKPAVKISYSISSSPMMTRTLLHG